MVVIAPPKLQTRNLPICHQHYNLRIEYYTVKSHPLCRLAVGCQIYTLFVERYQHCHQAYNGQYNNEHFLLCKLSVNYSFSVLSIKIHVNLSYQQPIFSPINSIQFFPPCSSYPQHNYTKCPRP
jgi:hypothetical protein